MAFFGRKSPLEALVMPAVFKYRQIRERRREAQSKKVTERELNALHNKIVSICKLKNSLNDSPEICHFMILLLLERKPNFEIKILIRVLGDQNVSYSVISCLTVEEIAFVEYRNEFNV